ncbi:MAG: DeoR/GlpR family DNA-binding transcription regulator [Lachnospiraceae bacterium]|nr:DeoR/GlpR family DNA-binding transcription regulator [Lachnospiraceae bacterium]
MNEQNGFETMLPKNRQEYILNIVKQEKSARVSDLAERLFINEATIRRDLNTLARAGLVQRIYGGAVYANGLDSEIPLIQREEKNAAVKKEIAQQACALIENGDTIFLDSSSTVSFMVPFLRGKEGLKIVTNGAKLLVLLSALSHASICSIGGELRENSLSLIGQGAMDALGNYYFDKAFFSCHACSEEYGLMDNNEEEARLRRLLIRRSRQSYLLADQSKFGKPSFYKICDMDEVSRIITG